MNTPATEAIAKIEAFSSNLSHKNEYKIKPTIPVVAIINKKLLSGEASA